LTRKASTTKPWQKGERDEKERVEKEEASKKKEATKDMVA
jgi:hypothetical protein